MANPLLAIAQIRPAKADYPENLRRIGSVFAQVAGWHLPPDIVVFPETVTSGYFLEGGVQSVAASAESVFRDLTAQHALVGAPPVDVVVGFYERYQHRAHNTALYASLGGTEPGIRHVHRKIFLPTYGVFDEQRFVESGHDIRAFDTPWGRAAILICEDAWHSLVPTLAALDGAQLLFLPSASPARGVTAATVLGGSADHKTIPGSLEHWERLVRMIAMEHGVFVVLAQLVGFEGGKGFPGASMVVGPDGGLLARGPLFEEALVMARLDRRELDRARAAMPLLSDLETEFGNLVQTRNATSRPPVDYDRNTRSLRERPSVPAAPAAHAVHGEREPEDPLRIDPELVTRWLVAFLEEEILLRRRFEKGLVGLSGGVDSSVTAALAARALGAENVLGVRMPYTTSSSESLQHAALIAEQLGIELKTVEITGAVDGYVGAVDPKPEALRLGNVMARLRMVTLFDLSAAYRALPLGTGNKSERLLGYFTWHADDTPPINPLGDLFKTQVWALADYLGIPADILTKPATADLIRGQTDEEDLGISYRKADLILHWLLRGLGVPELMDKGFAASEVEVVRARLESTHWKRRLPTVAMVSGTAIGEYYLRPVDY